MKHELENFKEWIVQKNKSLALGCYDRHIVIIILAVVSLMTYGGLG